MSIEYWYRDKRWKTYESPMWYKVTKILSQAKVKVRDYLDIGCGDGKLTYLIAQSVDAENVIGIDPSERMLKQFLQNVKAKNLKALRMNFDEEGLPFPDNTFDLVTAIEIIHHLLNPDRFFEEVRRVIKPRGFFLVTLPNLAVWFNRLLLLFGFQPVHTDPSGRYWVGTIAKTKNKASHHGHYTPYTYKALREMLRYYDFKMISTDTFSFFYRYPIVNFLNRLAERIPSIADGMIILACSIK